MVNKKDETRQCANTNRASVPTNHRRNDDMSSLAISNFNFQGVTLKPVERAGDLWFSSADLAKALGYKKTDAVTQIYSRYSDEFGANMSTTLRERVVRKTGSVEMLVRFFSLRGAHLVAMFATTNKAKEFRRWVLDILDLEVAHSPITKQFTDDELCSLAWLWRASDTMLKACDSVTPLLKVAEHRQAGHFHSIGQELPRTINKARDLIKRETAHIEFQPWRDDNWSRVLPHLRQEMLQ